MNSQKGQLRLTNKLPGKNLIMELWVDDKDEIQKYKEACYELLGRQTQWFHQCNSETYQMFEFWIAPEKYPMVIEQCKLVAKELGRDLVVDIEG